MVFGVWGSFEISPRLGDDMQGVNCIGAHAWLPFYALNRILINSYLYVHFEQVAHCPPLGMNDILCFRTVLFSINRQVPLKIMSSPIGSMRCYGSQGEQLIELIKGEVATRKVGDCIEIALIVLIPLVETNKRYASIRTSQTASKIFIMQFLKFPWLDGEPCISFSYSKPIRYSHSSAMYFARPIESWQYNSPQQAESQKTRTQQKSFEPISNYTTAQKPQDIQ
jgi:hypothetical protein